MKDKDRRKNDWAEFYWTVEFTDPLTGQKQVWVSPDDRPYLFLSRQEARNFKKFYAATWPGEPKLVVTEALFTKR
jgi:tryptophanyl-tRNA synthetase